MATPPTSPPLLLDGWSPEDLVDPTRGAVLRHSSSKDGCLS